MLPKDCGVLRYWAIRGSLVWLIWGMLAGRSAQAQVIERLVISADDFSGSGDPRIGDFTDRDRVYNPSRQNVRFRLVYQGVVDSSSVRGVLNLRGREGSLDRWVLFGGESRDDTTGIYGNPQGDSLGRSLSVPVYHDGGIVKFIPDGSPTELYQVYDTVTVAHFEGSRPTALNVRPTFLKADGQDLWVAGVFPGGLGRSPKGFLARRHADGSWQGFQDTIDDSTRLGTAIVTALSPSSSDVWLGTLDRGLLRYHKAADRGQWYRYDGVAGEGITALAVEDDFTLWVGVRDKFKGRGLERVRVQGEQVEVDHLGGVPLSRFPSSRAPLPEDSVITAIVVDPQRGHKWVGTGGGGLVRLRMKPGDTPADTLWDVIPTQGREVQTAIAFRLAVEKEGDSTRYLWAATDIGLVRLALGGTLDEIAQSLTVFSKDNGQLPDNEIRDLAIKGKTKWLATSSGLVTLEGNRLGGLDQWGLGDVTKTGEVEDRIVALSVIDDTLWLGRTPTWYSDVEWHSRTWWPKADSLLEIKDVVMTAYLTNQAKGQILAGTMALDTKPPQVTKIVPPDSATLYLPNDEIAAVIDDGIGVDFIRVYINPRDATAPESVPSLYQLGNTDSSSVYWSCHDCNDDDKDGDFMLDTLKYNFGFHPKVEEGFKGGQYNTVILEVNDRAGNQTRKTLNLFVQDLDSTTVFEPTFLNYPNPFGGGTARDERHRGPTLFRYVLKSEGHVTLGIFDLSGVLVKILVQNELRKAGTHLEVWDGRDQFENPLANGVYLCQLVTGNERRYTKAVILR